MNRAALWANVSRLGRYQSFMAVTLTLVLVPNVALPQTDLFSETVAPAFRKYCANCHGAGAEIEGETNLVALRSETLSEQTELIGRVIEALDLNEMPPEGEPQPTPELRKQLVRELKSILRRSVDKETDYARTPIRRMNRFQYNNAVVDLFELDCIVFTLPERVLRNHKGSFKPETGQMANVVSVGNRPLGKSQMIEKRLAGVAAFPQDLRAEHGYDNQGDHLSLSPLLMEAFLKLGQSITQSPDFTKQNVGIWSEFFSKPVIEADIEAEVKRRLEPFLSRAFRRKVDPGTLARYASFVIAQLESGTDFLTAMKSVAAATISSPRFLYLYEDSPGGEPDNALADFELASRLSFFLWGSIPDASLLDLAAGGTLKNSFVLEQEIARMLKDPKIKRFCDSFPTQWLQLDRIISSVPNRKLYPDFYYAKYRDSMHMMLEPLLLFETVLIEDMPITQLIDSDFTYRSGLLEEAYGELRSPPVEGRKQKNGEVAALTFHRVPVSDRRSGGVITNAAVMTMTSGPDRTQPITRGAWVAGVIFNNPPEPPPANVPALDEKPADSESHLTLRERLAMHRKRADCKGCHEQIDPLGFALENYSPIGTWRDEYSNGREVDMGGTLMKTHAFTDVVQFKDAILAEKDRFTRGLAGHLLSFGLARELEAADQIALDKIVEATIADEYRMQALLKHVITCEPFMRTTEASAGEESNALSSE